MVICCNYDQVVVDPAVDTKYWLLRDRFGNLPWHLLNNRLSVYSE